MGLTAPCRTLEFCEVAAPRVVGAGDASTVCGGAPLGTGVWGSAGSSAGQGGNICQQQGTACSALVDATERDSPEPTAVSPRHVCRRSSDKKDAGLARSHRSPVLPEGDKCQPKDGDSDCVAAGDGARACDVGHPCHGAPACGPGSPNEPPQLG